MDQQNGSGKQTSYTDQFFIFETLLGLHIQRFTFQFVLYIPISSEANEGLVLYKNKPWVI